MVPAISTRVIDLHGSSGGGSIFDDCGERCVWATGVVTVSNNEFTHVVPTLPAVEGVALNARGVRPFHLDRPGHRGPGSRVDR